jgi:translation initiation factor IF-2
VTDTATTPAPAAPVAAPVAPAPVAAPPPAAPREVVDTRALVESERAKAAAEIEAARKAAADEVAKVRAEADARILEVEASSVLRAIGVLRPDHALKLMGDQLAVVNGKLVSRADPTKAAADTIKAWVEGEGKYMLGPSIPAGGSGAPASAATPAGKPAPDLHTPDGAQSFVDDILTRAITAARKV